MSSEVIARRLLIRGRVQGVFFRDSVRRAARREGVSGWALNRDDGAVEVRLEGPPEAVERMIEFCREGPPRARVEHVDINDTVPEGAHGFEIR